MATAKKATSKAAAVSSTSSSTVVALKKPAGGALVSIKDQMAKELAGLADRTAPAGGDKVQLKGKVFKLPDGSESETLNVVIVDFMAVNNFYEGTYDPNNIQPPACFAIGQNPTQLVPSDNAPVKQSDSCAACPMNQFGSSGNGKACKNQRRLAILPPDADADTPLWVLDVSPTGLKSFDGYVRSAASKFGLLPVGLVTEISFDPNVQYASLRFGNPEPNENMEVHWGRRQEAVERLMQEPDVSAYGTVAPPKSRAKPAPRAAARR